jgi:hypothetical protein
MLDVVGSYKHVLCSNPGPHTFFPIFFVLFIYFEYLFRKFWARPWVPGENKCSEQIRQKCVSPIFFSKPPSLRQMLHIREFRTELFSPPHCWCEENSRHLISLRGQSRPISGEPRPISSESPAEGVRWDRVGAWDAGAPRDRARGQAG